MDANGRRNRLAGEKSPYLLQHAHNPVDWYPWGDEAFARAKAEDKPIFLSVGYSTCHWCHVMARECFEDGEVAAALNRDFVSVKVDREERPDVDAHYMEACERLTGSGGWPLSVFLGPDGRAFFAGTYFPKDDRPGMTGLVTLLERIAGLWKTDRPGLDEWARQLQAASERKPEKPFPVDVGLPDQVFAALELGFDPENGGFSGAPKFPVPQDLLFLLRYWAATGKEKALWMCEKTLSCMRRGGIYDQIGFGFCRYSTDERWLIPHFEKMLSDNALLCAAYAECWQDTGDPEYRRTAEEILSYLSGRMRAENGGFCTAEDADSEGGEGSYYVFSLAELREILGGDAEEFCRYFGAAESGNFEGKNVLNLLSGEIPEDGRDLAERCRRKVLAYRDRRVPPFLDDKLLPSRGGMAVAAFALAGRAFGEARYVDAAKRTASFFLGTVRRPDGSLPAFYRDGPSETPGFAEDYAYLIRGLLELYAACQEPRWLQAALELERVFSSRFEDRENGGFYTAEADAERTPARRKEIFDSSMPSANAVHAHNLIRLSRLTGEEEFGRRAQRALEAFSAELSRAPAACPGAASAVLYLVNGGTDVTLTARDPAELSGMRAVLDRGYRPFLTVRTNPRVPGAPEAGETAAAYVCSGKTCFPPAGTAGELEKLLK